MNHFSFAIFISLLAFFAAYVKACTIEILIKSETVKPVYAQFTSPDGQQSPLWLFQNIHQNERFQIKMNDCSKSPMIVDTYKVEGKNKQGALIHSTKAFVNGNGYIDYSIRDNRQAVIVGRVGVLCSFGECGARGKRSIAILRGDRR